MILTNIIKSLKPQSIILIAELARNTLTELDKISIDKIEQILRLMPDSWFSMQQRQEVVAWWDSSAKTERVTRLKTEIR